MTELNFEVFHTRNLQIATLLRQHTILIAGAGAVGSTIAVNLALMGANIIVVDPDKLVVANLPRTRADKEYVGIPKGLAVAATTRGLVPQGQRVTGLPHDLLELPQTEVWNLVQECNAVVAATGNDDADWLLNWICLHLAIPLMVPSMWPQGHEILADLLVVPAHQQNRAVGCFECLRPSRPAGTPMLEAQAGLAAEIGMVASVAAMTVVGALLPDSDAGRGLDRLLGLGAGYRIIRRHAFDVVPVRNPQRPGCQACAALRERDAESRLETESRSGPRRPWHAALRARLEGFLV